MAVDSLSDGLAVLDKRTTFVRIAIYVFLVSWALTIPFAVAEATEAFSFETSTGPMAMVSGLVLLVSGIDTFVCFVAVGMWLHRAHANLRLAELEDLDFTPGWAVGWYFVPIANLIQPFKAMRELVNRSHGLADAAESGVSAPLLPIWWAGWLIGNVLSNISARMAIRGEGLMSSSFNFLDVAGTLFSLASAWCLLKIIAAVHRAQHSSLSAAHAFA
jgi:Domain of unknown function (DUF4328)